MRKALLVVAGLVLMGALAGAAGCGPTTTSPTGSVSSATAPDPKAQQLVETKCSGCHSIDRVNEAKKTRDEWRVTVDRMVANGLELTTDENTRIVDYLTARDAAR